MHILAPHISCVVLPHELEEALAQEYKQIYITTSKGILKHHVLRGQGRFIRTKVDSIPGYTEPKLEQGMNFLPAGKIPFELFEQVQAFFVKVMEANTAELEAMIHILYNPERGYHLGVPPQRISKASVSYDWNYIEPGTSIIVDIHSHNTMGAFFSGTDDRDDRGNISFSGVFGKLKDAVPSTIWRFNYLDKKYEASVNEIFEAPVRPPVEVPDEWMNKIEVYTPPIYTGGYSGQGNVGRFPGPGTRPGASVGKTPAQLSQEAKWRYPTTTSSNQAGNQVVRGAQNSPSQVGNGRHTANDFGFGSSGDFSHSGFPDYAGAEDALSHFFGHDEGAPGYGVPARGIPTETATVMDEGDDVPFAFGGSSNYDPRYHPNSARSAEDEAADPDFGVNSLLEDPEVDPVGKSSGESGLMDESCTDPAYEAIQVVHGTEVADAWWDIANGMSALDGLDELNQELMCDMFGLTSKEGQLQVIRELFNRLSPESRAIIETNGL